MSKYQDTVNALVAEVTAHENVVDGLVTLMRKLHDLLQAGVDNQDFTAIQNVIKMLQDKDVVLSQAVVDNTPADPNAGSPVVANADGSGDTKPGPAAGSASTDSSTDNTAPSTASTGKAGMVNTSTGKS